MRCSRPLLPVRSPHRRAAAPTLPEIRLAPGQAVPACVTPSRLDAPPHGAHHAISTRASATSRAITSCTARRCASAGTTPSTRCCSRPTICPTRPAAAAGATCDPKQNNFAGIGTTGGGVPGDSFPDVSSGVLAQMQHLIAYSGERVAKPLAPRTREKQDDIIELSRALRRPVRFDDLTNRWAADRNYATSIEWVADRYRQANCTATGEPLHPSDDDIEEQRSRQPRVAALAGPSAPVTSRAVLLRCLLRQLRRPGLPSDPLRDRRLDQLHRAAGGRGVRAAAGRRLHQDARAQRPDDRPLPLARARVRCALSSFAQDRREPACAALGHSGAAIAPAAAKWGCA